MHIVSNVAAKFALITVKAVLPSGAPADIVGVDVAILPFESGPTASTTWVTADWRPPVATVLLMGPLAGVVGPPSFALTVPTPGGDLWARVVDDPEIDAVLIDRVVVE